MNIKEAAEQLERSERAVLRYKDAGRLSARKVKVKGEDGKTREVLDFDADEVKALKAELDSPSQTISPQVQRIAPQDESAALAPVAGLHFLQKLFEGQTRGFEELRAVSDSWPVWLMRKQALEVTGLAPSWLAAGVRRGELPYTGTPHTRRFHRDDLRAFAERVKDAEYLARLLDKALKE
jgi:hypothetical protein